MQTTLPGTMRLLLTWLALMTLTLVSMWSAQLHNGANWAPLPLWGIALVLLSAAFKVQKILLVYLNLRISSSGWKGGFTCLLAATVLLIFLAYAAVELRGA